MTVFSTIVYVVLLVGSSEASLKCLTDSGNSVDWWFLYKENDGLNYAYFDSSSSAGFKRSSHTMKSGSNSALERTLNQVYGNQKSVNYAAYNDERPDGASEGSYGHCKGVLAFDNINSFSSAFWLIHSIPQFPNISASGYDFTASQTYGQSLLCISLTSWSEVDKAAEQLRYMKPYIYDSNQLNSGSDDNFGKLISKDWIKSKNIQTISSMGGTKFHHFARYGSLELDVMEGMISPTLGLHFVWETWRRNPEEDSYCPPTYTWMELNVNYISWADGTEFKETQDHAKIGAAYDDGSGSFSKYVCIGGLNRMTSQDGRGGGYACFVENNLWQSMTDAFQQIDYCT